MESQAGFELVHSTTALSVNCWNAQTVVDCPKPRVRPSGRMRRFINVPPELSTVIGPGSPGLRAILNACTRAGPVPFALVPATETVNVAESHGIAATQVLR